MTGFHVGLISDTHGLLRETACTALRGVDALIHAGDIGAQDIPAQLEAIAPLTCIRGNIDRQPWAQAYPPSADITLAGRRFHIVHNRQDLAGNPAAEGIDVVVCGHSHKPYVEHTAEVLYVNPGSAGPRRFSLPTTVAILKIRPGKSAISADIVPLKVC